MAVACKPLLGCWGPTRAPSCPVTDRRHPPGHHLGRRMPPGPGDRGRWRAPDTPVPGTTTRQRDAPRGVPGDAGGPDHRHRTPPHAPTQGSLRSACPGAGPGATRPRRALPLGPGDATLTPGEHGGASAGERTTPTTPLLGPGTTTTAPQAGGCSRRPHQRALDHRAARMAARPLPGTSPAVGRGTGWCGDVQEYTVRVAWGRRAWSAFSLGHARKQGCAQQPNARFQARPIAAARNERRLSGVACKPLLGGFWHRAGR